MRHDVLRVDISRAAGAAAVTVQGEINLGTAHTLRVALDELGADERVLLDLASLHFMDSTGVDVLVGQTARIRQGGGSLHICNPCATVRRVVDIAGVAEFLFGHAPVHGAQRRRSAVRVDKVIDQRGVRIRSHGNARRSTRASFSSSKPTWVAPTGRC